MTVAQSFGVSVHLNHPTNWQRELVPNMTGMYAAENRALDPHFQIIKHLIYRERIRSGVWCFI